ncbi:amino acid adenylation domain-containing protein [Paenibacillus chartarius]|uniref:Amino acid adenylation domain-containing protein n=1 Tax=Paenibacillus chartarius TaxID=747481 RepID=A0ABV6DTP6_9BACL
MIDKIAQQMLLTSGRYEKEKLYWASKLQNDLGMSEFPRAARGDSASADSGANAGSIRHSLSPELASRLLGIGRTGYGVFMLLLSGVSYLLHRYASAGEVRIGMPIFKQNQPANELMNTMLVIQTEYESSFAFRDWAGIVRQVVTDANEHQNIPFLALAELAQIPVQADGTAEVPTLVMLEGVHDRSYIAPIRSSICFVFSMGADRIDVTIEYDPRRYTEAYAASLAVHLERILRAVETPDEPLSRLELLTAEERELVAVQFNRTQLDLPQRVTLHGLFEEQAKRSPGQTAVALGTARLTYRELNARANRLARTLRERGALPDTVVAIVAERSLDMIVALLAVMKAGAAYLPIDPAYPEERIAYLLEDSRATLVVTQFAAPAGFDEAAAVNLNDEASFAADDSDLAPLAGPEHLAYIIYTSGTTGKPKGVMIEHRGVTNSIQWRAGEYALSEQDVVLQLFSFSFDGFVTSFFTPIICGSTVVLLTEDDSKDPLAIRRHIAEAGVTHFICVPSLYNAVLESMTEDDARSLRIITVAGERMTDAVIERSKRLAPQAELVNEYGPTETSVVATICRDLKAGEPVTIGVPIANTRVYIVNEQGQLMPVGVPGELCIAGKGLARGYWNRAELTADKFVACPFEPGERMYRTGDLARWLPDGRIDYIDRIDHQVKVRGYRIELGEIETVLLRQPSVKEAVVLARDDAYGQKMLCAYITAEDETALLGLRERLSAELPSYMVPAHLIQLADMPRLPNGKLDRKALPEPDGAASAEEEAVYEAPSTELQERLCAMWQELLGADRIGIKDHFFKRGGHSLKAMMLLSQMHKAFGVEVPLRIVFDSPTVEGIAAYIEEQRGAGAGNRYADIEPVPARAYYPVSSAQKRMFVVSTLEGSGSSYNLPNAMIIEGELDVARLQHAFRQLVSRHETLRTRFVSMDGEPVQIVEESVPFDIPYLETTEDQIDAVVEAFVRPFDLGDAPLFRVELYKLNDNKHLLLYDMHHIISDGVSSGIVVREFVELYQGGELPALRVQYKDYAVWQQERLGTEAGSRQEQYWLNRFAGPLPVLDLPTDFPRPPVQSFQGGVVSAQAERGLLDRLQELAKRTNTTLYMVLFAAYNVLLAKYSGKDDIVVGSPTAGRQHADTEPLIGMFVGTLAMRSRPEAGKTFAAFLEEVKATTLEAFEHQSYPFESLIEKLDLQRDISRNPLFDTMFIVQNMDLDSPALPGLNIVPVGSKGTVSKFDLSLQAREAEEGLLLSVEYSSALYREATIARMIGHYVRILEAVVARPETQLGEIEMITAEEKRVIIQDFNLTRSSYPRDASVAELFRQQAALTPDHPALTFRGKALTYRELDERSNALANRLLAHGVGREEAVGIYSERSMDMVVAILAVLKAGASFVTLDPAYPEERIRHMLEDSAASVCLKFEAEPAGEFGVVWFDLADESLYSGDKADPDVRIGPNDLAYYMYTSGSTGKPKGVMVEQRGIVRLVKQSNYTRFEAGDSLLLTGAVGFDAITYEIFGMLLNGLTLHVVDKDVLLSADLLAEHIRRLGVTLMWMTTPLFNQLSEVRPDVFAGIKQIIIGGELISMRHVNRVRRHCPGIEVFNAYGPTENTTFSTGFPILQDYEEPAPIGKPISNSTAYIVDAAGYLQPIGVPGELIVGGDGVARGYANLPELSADKFVPNPYAPGERMYKSGDLARWLPDGNIEYLGRIDLQVKIRGYRIELGEIEAAIMKLSGMKATCVVPVTDPNGQKVLCAYYVCEEPKTAGQLRESLSRELPSYMVPLYFLQLEQFPLTSNGKIDRRALPAPDYDAAAAAGADYVAPRNETEAAVASLWEETLGVKQVGVYDDFFALGGHSLKAMTLLSRLKQRFGADVPLRALFEAPTVAALAAYIDGVDKAALIAIEPAPEQAYYPLSPAQKRLFVLSRFEGAGVSYNLPRVMTVEGELEPERLEAVFRQLIARHDALRTSFRLVDGEPVQFIADPEELEFAIARHEASEADVPAIVQSFIRPFDLETAPLLRAELVKLEPQKHVLLCDMHHIIADGVSMSIFMKEFTELYEGAELPSLRIQYKDYAVWLDSGEGRTVMSRQEAYWREAFAEEIPLLALPTDYPRPAVKSFEGSNVAVRSGAELKSALDRLAARTGATLYMVLLAAYQVLLHKYSGQDDIIVGTPVAGRPHADVEPVIGMFVNTLALRGRPEPLKTFEQLLDEVKRTTLDALDNQHYPFDALVEQLNVPRDLSRNPLFDTMFSLQNINMDTREMTGLQIEPYPFEGGAAKFDLSLEATATDDELVVSFEYGSALFRHDTVERMAGHYLNILAEAAANPQLTLAEIDMVSEREKMQILEQFNDTAAEYPSQTTLYRTFEATAAAAPDRVAVIDGERTLTYGELNERANRLARKLRSEGVAPDRIVPLLMERAAEMIVGILAIQKAGGAYLPIDPEFPEDRIQYMLDDSGAEWLLTQTKHAGKARALFEGGSVLDLNDPASYETDGSNLEPAAGPRNLAYVIYTSGSTGKPKGVMIEHGAAMNRIHWMQKAYPLSDSDVILQKTPYTFDVSVWEMFWWGFVGAAVCFLKPGGEKNPEEIVSEIERSGVTTMHFVPSMLSLFLDYIEGESDAHVKRLSGLRFVFASGEALQLAHVQRFNRMIYSRCGARLINLYGPTEATVDVSYYDCSTSVESGIVPIGKPIDNIQLYIVGDGVRLQPIGVPGELCIAGVGVARGYVNKPELTDEKFVDNPWSPGMKMYRTGDLARWLPDGTIEYLGRIDFQVKIRGYRIELGELETALLKHDAVRETVVVALEDEEKLYYLCAYFTADRELTVTELREHLGRDLPSYMIPAHFVQLESMPLSPNGKINRKALPKPEGRIATGTEYVAPRTPTEELLAGLWQEALGVERIGVHDSFFALGGHSLKAMSLLAQTHKTFGIELPLRFLFESPTIEAAGRYIDEQARGTYQAIVPAPKQEYYAVSSAQKRMFILNLFEEGGESLAYNMPSVVGLEGPVDAERFEQALQQLIARHESLRTSFHTVQGEPMQRIHDEAPFRLERLVAASEEAAAKALDGWFRPFDLAQAPLLRAALIRIEDCGKHVFVYDTHHIVSDGVSGTIFIEELIRLYEGEQLPQLELHYKDFALWQNEWMAGEQFLRQEQYWLAQMSGVPVLELPTDLPRPAVKSFAGAVREFEASTELVEAMERLARDSGATLYMVLLAAFKVLLSKYSGQSDIVVGSPIAGRSHADTAGMLGMFVNSLAIRSDVSAGKTFRELVADVKTTVLSAFEHQDYPFELLVEKLQLTRDLSRNPLFDTVLVWQNAGGADAEPEQADRGGELRIVPFGQEHTVSKFDLSLIAAPHEGALRLSFEYSTALFHEETIARMTEHLLQLLEAAAAAPDQAVGTISLTTEGELVKLRDWNATAREYAGSSLLHGLFEEQAELMPQQPALVQGSITYTYAQLNAKANRLARSIRSLGAGGTSHRVAVIADRTPEMVIGILAVLKAGAAYVPVDPDYPADRIRYLLEDSGASLVLGRGSAVPDAVRSYEGVNVIDLDNAASYHDADTKPDWSVSPDDVAYVIYTSGTTGKPKGVMIRHRSIANTVKWRRTEFGFGPQHRALQIMSFAFDASVISLFTPLASGTTSYMVPAAEAKDPIVLKKLITLHGITHLNGVPSLFGTIIHLLEPAEAESLQLILLGGEPITSGLVEMTRNKNARVELVNEYGPTESSVMATFMRGLEPNVPITIGRPIANTRIYIVDDQLRQQPIGIRGELCIAGDGLAKGYLNQPELTDDKFVDCPFEPGARMYRTGDAARWLPDGTIEFCGRIDQQVKVRGYRIELAEIDAVLLKQPGVKEATTQAWDDAQGQKYLCAYIVADRDEAVAAARERAASELPAYMVPPHFVRLERLPLTPNGKIDARALPKPDTSIARAPYAAPRTEDEKKLTAVWEELLGIGQIGINDPFFEIGGNSLKATMLTARVYEELHVELPFIAVFQYPTIAKLAGYMARRRVERSDDRPVTLLNRQAQRSLFCFPPVAGYGFYYQELAGLLEEANIAVYGFDFIQSDDRFEQYVKHIRTIQPEGPYRLMGYSAGGNLAFRVAQELEAAGCSVSDIIMLDAEPKKKIIQQTAEETQREIGKVIEQEAEGAQYGAYLQNEAVRDTVFRHMVGYMTFLNELDNSGTVAADIHLIESEGKSLNILQRQASWSKHTTGRQIKHKGAGPHEDMLEPAHLPANAALIRQILG